MKIYKEKKKLIIDGKDCIIIKNNNYPCFESTSDFTKNVEIRNFYFAGYDTFRSKIKLIWKVWKFINEEKRRNKRK